MATLGIVHAVGLPLYFAFAHFGWYPVVEHVPGYTVWFWLFPLILKKHGRSSTGNSIERDILEATEFSPPVPSWDKKMPCGGVNTGKCDLIEPF